MIIDDLIADESIPEKYRTFIELVYLKRACTYEKIKQYWISERTYYRRRDEIHVIIKEKWQEKEEHYLKKWKEDVKKHYNRFIFRVK